MDSVIAIISPQADGRAYVRERHTDQLGVVHDIEYLESPDNDRTATLQVHAEQLTESLRQQELDYWLAEVSEGRPIPVDGCKYVERGVALAYCLHTLALAPNPQALYRAAWMIPYFTDDEFLAAGFTTNQIAEVRSRAATLDQARQILNTVTPVGGA